MPRQKKNIAVETTEIVKPAISEEMKLVLDQMQLMQQQMLMMQQQLMKTKDTSIENPRDQNYQNTELALESNTIYYCQYQHIWKDNVIMREADPKEFLSIKERDDYADQKYWVWKYRKMQKSRIVQKVIKNGKNVILQDNFNNTWMKA